MYAWHTKVAMFMHYLMVDQRKLVVAAKSTLAMFFVFFHSIIALFTKERCREYTCRSVIDSKG